MSKYLVLSSFLLVAAVPAHAESNRFNLHVSPGVYVSDLAIGADVGIGADWQFITGLALDLRLSTLLVANGFGFGPAFNPALGLRIRLLDDHEGYTNQPNGNLKGHLAIAPHVGALIGIMGAGLTIDTEVAYVFSVSKPLQLGPFVRPFVGFGTWGITGGVTIGLALNFGLGPEMGLDSDHDGVGDDRDKCPGTPEQSEVDSRGCTIVPKSLVLDGITFRFNSAEIEPASVRTLERVLTSLQDNPEARVEISGHTDDVGNAERNQTLSEERARSVAEWLRTRGVDAGRMTTRGYGSTKPITPNTDDASRARNRRIEFNRTDLQ